MGYLIRRIDENQNEIVKIFRQLGASVFVTSMVGHGFGDIVVGFRGKNYIFELKDESKRPASRKKFTIAEKTFMDNWKGHIGVLYSVEDVIKFMEIISL
jgi:hypothetical protein